MKVDARETWTHWRFGLILAALLIGYELLMAGMLVAIAPAGQRWLGPLVFNAADHAVYLNYLGQGTRHFMISNLYDDLVQTPRFDVFWSFGGLLVRAGLTNVWAHEILRWLSTLALAFTVYVTAKTLYREKNYARWSSFIIVSGMSLGWVYALWRDLGGPEFTTLAPTPPDLITEFGTAPILLGGAHIILSTALLLLIMRWTYEVVRQGERRKMLWLVPAILYFTWLHPYFIALVGCQIVFSLIGSLGCEKFRQRLWAAFLACLSLVPATTYYAWVTLSDSAFKAHQFEVNQLSMGSVWVWLIVLLPFFWAMSRLLFKQIPSGFYWEKFPKWIIWWIASAIICILLPFPWKRKYTQGLLMASTMLTMPYWLYIIDRIKRALLTADELKTVLLSILAGAAFLLFATASYWYLFQAQLSASLPRFSGPFYKPQAIFAAWRELEASKPGEVITDELTANLWTPAYTRQHIYLGHAHETPNYVQRYYFFKAWSETQDTNFFNAFLDYNRIDYVLVTKQQNQAKFASLFDSQIWKKTFEQGTVTLWSRD